jgi:hypothetical protein
MAGGHGQRGQVSNEEVPYHACSVQDVMIEDLQRQVAELTQRLATQNLEMYSDVDGRNSKSNFENPYHKPVLVREQRVWDKWHEEVGFKVEHPEFSSAMQAECFIDWLHRVERIFDYKEVLDNMKVKLVAIKLKVCASAWWKQLKQSRYRQGKPKINNWEKLVKHMRTAFLPPQSYPSHVPTVTKLGTWI